jgi:hypothetical protein
MARSISDIYNQMIAEKETFSNLGSLSPLAQVNPAQSLLSDLSSTSKVAIWRLIFYVVSVAIWIHEKLYDSQINNAIASTLPWWNKTVKAFQFGDILTWNGQAYVYQNIDTTNQIVSQCAIIVADKTFYIKVATGTDTLAQLTNDQVTALTSYLNKVVPAGSDFNIVNLTADLLKITYTVYIDPLLINISDGSSVNSPTDFPIQDVINEYIQHLDIYDFNGIFYVEKLTQTIFSVPGVKNAIANTVQAKSGTLSYQDILSVVSQTYNATSGYLQIDPSYPLSSSITFYSI